MDMLAFSGHEINNVLSRLLLNIELLSREDQANKTDRHERAIRNLNQNAQMLHSIAKSYIALARVTDQSRTVYSMTTFEPVSQIIEPLVSSYSYTLAEHNLTVEIGSSDAKGLSICADHSLMTSVFDNLLNNAIKYGEPGTLIQITLSQVAGNIEISFKNHAQNIDEQAIAHLFDRFTRGPNIHNKNGSGIGLYLVKQVIETHGGTVRAEVTPNDEVIFTVSIPGYIA